MTTTTKRLPELSHLYFNVLSTFKTEEEIVSVFHKIKALLIFLKSKIANHPLLDEVSMFVFITEI